MALPSTGPLSMSQVAVELSRSATAQIALGEAAVRKLANLPSGPIGLLNLRGKSAAIIYTATNLASLNLATAFGPDYGVAVDKRLIVPAGIALGPVTIPTGLSGSLTIENAGEIQGLGGAANGGAGGDAITASVSFTLINTGAVRGGGGGGGLGGAGGQGSVSSMTSNWVSRTGAGLINSSNSFTQNGWAGVQNNSGIFVRNDRGVYSRIFVVNWGFLFIQFQAVQPVAVNQLFEGAAGAFIQIGAAPPGPLIGINYSYIDDFVSSTSTTYTSGGAGGAGGQGRGYSQSLMMGSVGANGGTNAGTGGSGGTGGDWGQAGATGGSGANGTYTSGAAGASGGAAGRAVRMLVGSLTLTNSGIINGAY
jgi:hypothetical protein